MEHAHETKEHILELYEMVDQKAEIVDGFGVLHRGQAYDLAQRAFRKGVEAAIGDGSARARLNRLALEMNADVITCEDGIKLCFKD